MDPDDPDKLSPEEKAAQDKAAKSLAAPQTRSEDIRRRFLGVGLLLCTVIFGLGVWTLGAVFKKVVSTGPIEDDDAPVAVATSCEQLGPVSRFGFGYWWECSADVRSATGGPPSEKEFHGSELTPADIGKPVHVTATNSGSARDSSTTWERNTTRPLEFMQVVVVIVAFLPFLYLLTQGLSRVLPLWLEITLDKNRYREYYAKYLREGRLSPDAARELTPPPKKKEDKEDPTARGIPQDSPLPSAHQAGPGQQPPTRSDDGPGRGS